MICDCCGVERKPPRDLHSYERSRYNYESAYELQRRYPIALSRRDLPAVVPFSQMGIIPTNYNKPKRATK